MSELQPRTAGARRASLAESLLDSLSDDIRDGRFAIGERLPTEAAIMVEHGVSRTVVREAISKLQARGMVETRHGIGTFVLGMAADRGFRLSREHMGTLQDVIAVLELRIGVETEAAALAALRRTERQLLAIGRAVEAFGKAVEAGADAVGPDFQFHLGIAQATQNKRFVDLMNTFGQMIIPRSRLQGNSEAKPARSRKSAASPISATSTPRDYLVQVNREHQSILDAVRMQDPEAARAAMRMHLSNSRERRRRLMPDS